MMMSLYPGHATEALAFHKILLLLQNYCRTDAAKQRAAKLQPQTNINYIEKALQQTEEYKQLIASQDNFPNHFTLNISKELQLLKITGSALSAQQLLHIKQLTVSIRDILIWFKKHHNLFPELELLSEKIIYEKSIVESIDTVIDDHTQIKDHASKELQHIRNEINNQRQLLRKAFDAVLRKLARQGYLADISESYLNGRRTLAVLAEYKRQIKGILHGESDTQKTVFIEPAETIELNNDLVSLEQAEKREVQKILAMTTAAIAPYHFHVESYAHICGLYDFIRAKAFLAKEMNAAKPHLQKHPGVDLIQARHPLLYLQHKEKGKETLPLSLKLGIQHQILIISGPNAGGKTVAMKTIGLLQLMVQSGLLIPAKPASTVGIFKQLMVHIGDTQSIEHELSTYSAHLRDMKYFMEFANGKTLFLIDELGSGSDPNLGGAFAEAIVEALARKHAMGIITTHYLNLKIMAGKIKGIFNGAMSFDEEKLEPLYQLIIGKPGSSYTFAIAERTGLPPSIIQRARELTDKDHFKLDKILLKTEQQNIQLDKKNQQLEWLLTEHEKAKKHYETIADKEQQQQHLATLKLQNKIKKEELEYLRDMERKFKQIIHDWKKTENKQEVIKAAEKVLFKRKQIATNKAAAKKADKNYETIGAAPQIGSLVRHTQNHQIGIVTSLKGKKAVVQIGNLPFQVNIEEWVAVRRKNKGKHSD